MLSGVSLATAPLTLKADCSPTPGRLPGGLVNVSVSLAIAINIRIPAVVSG